MNENKRSKKNYNRGVSLDSPLRSDETNVRVNPMFAIDEHPSDASVRRQVSEPARNRFTTVRSNVVNRASSIKSIVKKNTADFFVVSEQSNDKDEELWRQRRNRLLTRKFGKLKDDVSPSRIQSFPMSSAVPSSATGDVVDGFSHVNKDRISESVSRTDNELMSSESRTPVYQLTMSGIASLTSKIKRRVSQSRADRLKMNDVNVEPLPVDSVQTPDSVFYPDGDSLDDDDDGEDDEDFFKKPDDFREQETIPSERYETDIVDSRRLRSNVRPLGSAIQSQQYKRPLPKGGKWTMRQKSVDPRKLIESKFLSDLMDNSNRRTYGLGIVGRLFRRQLKDDLTKEERKAIEQIDDHIDDHRPYFTYWITTVQILILIISLCVYGFGPYGFGFAHKSAYVKLPSLALQQVDYYEPENFWLGPRAADLIHLGAKFTPCMRRDNKIFEIITDERAKERNTGCCIRNDGSGCIQTLKDNCSPLLSTWHNWNDTDANSDASEIGKLKRKSGPVCGQDPRYCTQPASIEPYEWNDDITKWPICRKKAENLHNAASHVSCELIGRPCCIGVYGQCHITSQEYCDFVDGFFHEEATLCSQVSCMENICGMIPFYSNDVPDQVYRVWTPIFLHAGLLHLSITVIVQFFIMRDIEKMTGSKRITIIYLFSGIGGYVASSIFIPFRAEVGPAGSHFGLLACLFVEVIKSWEFIENPWKALLKLTMVPIILFLIGLLPWVDNYAHIFGFIIGFLLSIALLPFITISTYSRSRKIIQIIVSLFSVCLIFIALFVVLYLFPIYNCRFCQFLNCIPFTKDFCKSQEIHVTRVDLI